MRAFLAIVVADGAFPETLARLDRLIQSYPELKEPRHHAQLIVASTGMAQRDLGDQRGVVLGRAIKRNSNAGDIPAATDRTAIFESRGRSLITDFWGGYVAFVNNREGGIDIVRAPLGDLPCYWIKHGTGVVLSSSARLIEEYQQRSLRVNWAALSRQLAFGTIRTTETCLDGLEEISGGQRLTIIGGSLERFSLWSPWTFASHHRERADPTSIATSVRDACLASVAGSVFGKERVLLKLSGGLDSSIVAACLAQSGTSFSGLTLVTDDPSGDERRYAHSVADHLGIPIATARRDPDQFELGRSPAHGLPRPSIPGFRQESDRLTALDAERCAATAVIDGGGGDNVFCSLQSAAPVADCLLDKHGWSQFLTTAASVAKIAHVSTLQVVRAAIARASERTRNPRWPRNVQFLSAAAIEAIPKTPAHPWLVVPNDILPGRAAHVKLIIAAQSYVEGLDAGEDPPLIAPLLAQPLVELCLRVPSWLWFDKGLNRASARRAFAQDLPDIVVRRSSKGSPDAFVAQILERHWMNVRTLLFDGLLASHDILDLASLRSILDDRRPIRDGDLPRVMNLVDAEVWARGWQA